MVRDRTDLIKDMLSILFLKGRIEKWGLVRVFIQLFHLAVKRQVRILEKESVGLRQAVARSEVMRLTTTPWQMYFDGSSTQGGAGAGLVFFSRSSLSPFRLNFPCTNNVAEYEALLIGLELAAGMRSIHVKKGSNFLSSETSHR